VYASLSLFKPKATVAYYTAVKKNIQSTSFEDSEAGFARPDQFSQIQKK
jgi:hypothetical protein